MSNNGPHARPLGEILNGHALHPLVLDDDVVVGELFAFVRVRDEFGRCVWRHSSGTREDRPSLGMILALEESYEDILDSLVAEWEEE